VGRSDVLIIFLLSKGHLNAEAEDRSGGFLADTRTPSPTISAANEGVKLLSKEAIQEHDASPRGRVG
jgi:hypothetical protein